MATIVSAFPGTGKTFFSETSKFIVKDSDSSKFSKENFPRNYIDHIKNLHEQPLIDFILVSSHEDVRNELIAENIPFSLVYPDRSLRDAYLLRYYKRGSPKAFIDLVEDNWDTWISQIEELDDPLVMKYRLIGGQYLSNVIGV